MCVCLHKHSQVGIGVKPVIKDHTVTRQACDLSTNGLQFVLRRVFTGSPRNTIFALRDGQKRKWTESLSQSSLGNHLVVQRCPDPTCQSRWERFFCCCCAVELAWLNVAARSSPSGRRWNAIQLTQPRAEVQSHFYQHGCDVNHTAVCVDWSAGLMEWNMQMQKHRDGR